MYIYLECIINLSYSEMQHHCRACAGALVRWTSADVLVYQYSLSFTAGSMEKNPITHSFMLHISCYGGNVQLEFM